jgi:hypothetical protein
MSTTRHAAEGSPLRQERFASSPQLHRGLMANLVAKRCAILEKPGSRELIWEIQHRSHQPGGAKQLASDIIAGYPESVGNWVMHKPGLSPDKPLPLATVKDIWPSEPAESARARSSLGIGHGRIESEWGRHPFRFTLPAFQELCLGTAELHLDQDIQRLCLDPELDIDEDPAISDPWYFDDLVKCLRGHFASRTSILRKSTVVTSIGRKVEELLHYAMEARCLTLAEGEPRTGKTFAARRWCEQHPGRARFVEVPPGNDDFGFYRALSRGLGVSINLNSKANELRDRVEEVLLSGDILLCLDEAHRAWPQTNLHRGWPARINWIMAMANQGVPIAMIATNQFLKAQRIIEDKTGWNGSQLTGRIGLYDRLPDRLSDSDLLKVASALLPEADETCMKHLVTYARVSSRYLAAVEYVSKRARYLAGQDSRSQVTTEDIRAAMADGVIPSDRAFCAAMQAASGPNRRGRLRPIADLSPVVGDDLAAPPRGLRPEPDFADSLSAPGRRDVTPAIPLQAGVMSA